MVILPGMRTGSIAIVLAALLAGACAAPSPPAASPPPPTPPPAGAAAAGDLEGPAGEAREALEAVLGAAVPAEAAVPIGATREELEADLVAELRPQVERLHGGSSPAAREAFLRGTAAASASSIVARYSAARRRVFLAKENIVPQMEAAGIPADGSGVRAFLTVALAHEMVHAIDDASFGLADLFRSAPDAEAIRALGMVVEGRAVHYARRVARRLGLPATVEAVLPGGKGPPDERRAKYLLTYREGAAFIAALEERGGASLAARPLRDPPRYTCTVLHPGRYGPDGEQPVPDLVPGLVTAGFAGSAAASELDLRSRWLPHLGEEAVAKAFAGFVAGAGLPRRDGSVGVSLHETAAHAAGYAGVLRSLFGMDGSAEEGTKDGLAVVVLVKDRVVANAVGPDAAAARRDAERALASVK